MDSNIGVKALIIEFTGVTAKGNAREDTFVDKMTA